MDNQINTPSIKTDTTPKFPTEEIKPKKKLSYIFIIIPILGVLILTYFVAAYLIKEKSTKSPDKVDNGNINNEVNQNDTKVTDVSEYTDIKLKDYTGFNVNVNIKDENDENQKDLIDGIVTYSRVTDERYPNSSREYLYIINKMSLTQEEITEDFEPVVNDIKNRNFEAKWLGSGYPWVLTTGIYGGANYTPLTEVKDVIYPNTDATFAVLALAHGHGTAPAGIGGGPSLILVFALKGDNIIEIYPDTISLMDDIGLTQEDDSKCSKESTEDEHLIYDEECISGIFQSGKYDANLKKLTEDLLTRFEIVE